MAENFKAGDTVKLKSGGPKMTVVQVGDNGLGQHRVWCNWFTTGPKPEEKDFPPEALTSA
jgi:uncharacterized protein YodC (DUF2158 family)